MITQVICVIACRCIRVLYAGTACGRRLTHRLVVWRLMTTSGAETELSASPMSETRLALVQWTYFHFHGCVATPGEYVEIICARKLKMDIPNIARSWITPLAKFTMACRKCKHLSRFSSNSFNVYLRCNYIGATDCGDSCIVWTSY